MERDQAYYYFSCSGILSVEAEIPNSSFTWYFVIKGDQWAVFTYLRNQ